MPTEIRKAVLDAVLERIHLERYQDHNKFARRIAIWFESNHPDSIYKDEFVEEFSSHTDFFRYNEIADRESILQLLFDDAMDAIDITPESVPRQLYVDDIDSFELVREVKPDDITVELPLEVLEDEVKRFLREIIGEPFDQQDWGGELTDLFTNRVQVYGDRVDTAFMLKGPGVSGEMYISDAGTRGDQLQRLFDSSAELYVVQFNGPFGERTVRQIKREAQYVDATMYCIMDGADTARVLQAYNKL